MKNIKLNIRHLKELALIVLYFQIFTINIYNDIHYVSLFSNSKSDIYLSDNNQGIIESKLVEKVSKLKIRQNSTNKFFIESFNVSRCNVSTKVIALLQPVVAQNYNLTFLISNHSLRSPPLS